MNLETFKSTILPLKNKLFRLAFGVVRDEERAKDVVQEVMIKIWKNKDQLNRIQNIEAWCMRMTKNLAIDKFRSAKKWVFQENGEFSENGNSTDPGKELESKELVQQIKKLLHNLPVKQKLVMQLRDIEGLTYQEISQTLDIPLNQVKINLFRARKEIRTQLSKTVFYDQ